jgi:hypothetical protein
MSHLRDTEIDRLTLDIASLGTIEPRSEISGFC